MIKAYVNEMGIVLELDSRSDDLSDVEWRQSAIEEACCSSAVGKLERRYIVMRVP
jgi:hypothetical protein